MNPDWMIRALCVAAAVPLVLGLCLLALVLTLRLALPAILMLLNAVNDLRDRQQQFALARMSKQIELAKVHHGRFDHVRAA